MQNMFLAFYLTDICLHQHKCLLQQLHSVCLFRPMLKKKKAEGLNEITDLLSASRWSLLNSRNTAVLPPLFTVAQHKSIFVSTTEL